MTHKNKLSLLLLVSNHQMLRPCAVAHILKGDAMVLYRCHPKMEAWDSMLAGFFLCRSCLGCACVIEWRTCTTFPYGRNVVGT